MISRVSRCSGKVSEKTGSGDEAGYFAEAVTQRGNYNGYKAISALVMAFLNFLSNVAIAVPFVSLQ